MLAATVWLLSLRLEDGYGEGRGFCCTGCYVGGKLDAKISECAVGAISCLGEAGVFAVRMATNAQFGEDTIW